jgi:hypothetical protein
MEKGEQHAQGIKQTLETMIGTDLSLKRKKKSEHDLNKELFEKIIIALERTNIRTALVGTEFDVDLSKYDETFYEVIDNLMLMQFGKQAAEVIFFYVYERMNPDGSINELRDTNDTPIVLNNPTDLWDLINVIKNASSKTTK